MTAAGLCQTRPPEFWDTGDPGNRLALALCRVCPARAGETCLAGETDPHPAGVIRAGVAYNERGRVCPVCECGYPVDDLSHPSRWRPGCRHCRVPRVRSWQRTFGGRRAYLAAYYRRRKATTCTDPTREDTAA